MLDRRRRAVGQSRAGSEGASLSRIPTESLQPFFVSALSGGRLERIASARVVRRRHLCTSPIGAADARSRRGGPPAFARELAVGRGRSFDRKDGLCHGANEAACSPRRPCAPTTLQKLRCGIRRFFNSAPSAFG